MSATGPAVNACNPCAPLGACLAFRGVAGGMPFLHGGQGCSTYIRRYCIGHFREPLDIACSNCGEKAAVFGGRDNLWLGLANTVRQYAPALIGVATTCLTETMGEDVAGMLRAWSAGNPGGPLLIHASTPSYAGTHADGWFTAVQALASQLAEEGGAGTDPRVVLAPSLVSPADLRALRDLAAACHVEAILLPDPAEALDGGQWEDGAPVATGGTPVADLRALGRCRLAIALGGGDDPRRFAVPWLGAHRGTPTAVMPLPCGVEACDALIHRLEAVAGRPCSPRLQASRSRLLDAYVDGHKHAAGRRAAVYGDEDTVLAVARLMAEVGMVPAVCATGAAGGRLRAGLAQAGIPAQVLGDADFQILGAAAKEAGIDLMVGHAKGYRLSRDLGVPLVRVGFPVHDRLGAGRLGLCGYEGTHDLLHLLLNACIAAEQDRCDVGYMTY